MTPEEFEADRKEAEFQRATLVRQAMARQYLANARMILNVVIPHGGCVHTKARLLAAFPSLEGRIA